MKKLFVVNFLLLFSVLSNCMLCGCSPKTTNNTQETTNNTLKKGILVINHIQFNEINVEIIDENEFRLPLVATLVAMNIRIEWIDDKNANVIWNDVYLLNISENEKSFAKPNSNSINYLDPAPGSTTYYCAHTESDIIVDITTFSLIVRHMGINIDYYADCEEAIAYIEVMQ